MTFKNLNSSKKFNGISIRFVDPAQLNFLIQKIKEEKDVYNKQLLLDLIKSVQIIGNADVLVQLQVSEQDSQIQSTEEGIIYLIFIKYFFKNKKTQIPCFEAPNNETVLNEAFAEIIKN